MSWAVNFLILGLNEFRLDLHTHGASKAGTPDACNTVVKLLAFNARQISPVKWPGDLSPSE
jgi:hypothetical protein